MGGASLGTKLTRQVTHEGEPASKLVRAQDIQATVNNLMQKALSTAGVTGGLESVRPSSSPAVVVVTPLMATDTREQVAAETVGRMPQPLARAGGSSSAPPGAAQVSGEGTTGSGSKLTD